MKWFYLALVGIILIYLTFRLSFLDTIEFGYDQPRLAAVVLDYLKSGSFINSQKYSIESPWGNLSWGPALVFFYAVFLKISPNPITASVSVSLFNLLSVLVVIYLGTYYFSRKVGLIAGLVLALHPWWIVFGRMVYQPTAVVTLVTISTLFLFKTIEKPRSPWASLLVFSWAVLLQIYLITFSFILTSFAILLTRVWKKRVSFLYFGAGISASTLLFLPSFYYYAQRRDMLLRFFAAGGKFKTSLVETFLGFTQSVSGGGFNWQLGYGYREFIDGLPGGEIFITICMVVITLLLLVGLIRVIKEKNLYAIYLVAFLLAPLWAIPIVGVEYAVPRYFLYTLPAFGLIFAISIEEFLKRFGLIALIIPSLIFLWWGVFIFKYYSFIESYNYPSGFLSHFSDVPYSFLDKSFKWIIADASEEGYREITISDDTLRPKEFSLNHAQRYYWEYLLGRNQTLKRGKVGHYLMYFTPLPERFPKNYAQFGPYVVYRVQD